MGANDIRRNGEEVVMNAAAATAAPGSHVFDVGANVGDWSEIMIEKMAPDHQQQLFCFEPSAVTFQRLQANGHLNTDSRVSLVHLGLSDVAGSLDLHVVHDGAGSNSIHRRDGTLETITLATADAFCDQRGVERISLMKMDVEGHELSVLRGATSLLTNGRIDMIQFEYTWRWIDARAYLRDAFDLFEPYGYRIFKISRFGFQQIPKWEPGLENFWEDNFLAVLPTVADSSAFRTFICR